MFARKKAGNFWIHFGYIFNFWLSKWYPKNRCFSFNGYLPVKNAERDKKLRELENKVYKDDQTQIFIETPYRNQKMLESILKSCREETKLCVATGITTKDECIKTKSILHWKKEKKELGKIPTIFLIYK